MRIRPTPRLGRPTAPVTLRLVGALLGAMMLGCVMLVGAAFARPAAEGAAPRPLRGSQEPRPPGASAGDSGVPSGPNQLASIGADQTEAIRELAAAGELERALLLTDVALEAEPRHRASLEVRIAVLEQLATRSANSNERGWLEHALRVARSAVGAGEPQ